MGLIRYPSLLTAALLLVMYSATASAGTVSGSLQLPNKDKRPSPLVKSSGFVNRTPHPLMAGKPVENPLPAMFVVLVGGPDAGEESPDRRPVELGLLGHRFEREVFPARVGQMIILKNVSTKTSNKGVAPRIDAPKNRAIFSSASDAGTPLNPNGERELALKDAFSPVELSDADNPHIRVTLVGTPNSHYATPSGNGSFDINDVPAGTWTARVWYGTGFLEGVDTKVTVPARGVARVKINIPPGMAISKPTQN